MVVTLTSPPSTASSRYEYFICMALVITVVAALVWFIFEAINPEAEMRSQMGAYSNAMWVTLLTLYGEAPWEAFTSGGRVLHVILMLLATPIFAIPCGIFANAYGAYLEELYFEDEDDEEEDDAHVGRSPTSCREQEEDDEEDGEDKPRRQSAGMVAANAFKSVSARAKRIRRLQNKRKMEEELRARLMPKPSSYGQPVFDFLFKTREHKIATRPPSDKKSSCWASTKWYNVYSRFLTWFCLPVGIMIACYYTTHHWAATNAVVELGEWRDAMHAVAQQQQVGRRFEIEVRGFSHPDLLAGDEDAEEEEGGAGRKDGEKDDEKAGTEDEGADAAKKAEEEMAKEEEAKQKAYDERFPIEADDDDDDALPGFTMLLEIVEMAGGKKVWQFVGIAPPASDAEKDGQGVGDQDEGVGVPQDPTDTSAAAALPSSTVATAAGDDPSLATQDSTLPPAPTGPTFLAPILPEPPSNDDDLPKLPDLFRPERMLPEEHRPMTLAFLNRYLAQNFAPLDVTFVNCVNGDMSLFLPQWDFSTKTKRTAPTSDELYEEFAEGNGEICSRAGKDKWDWDPSRDFDAHAIQTDELASASSFQGKFQRAFLDRNAADMNLSHTVPHVVEKLTQQMNRLAEFWRLGRADFPEQEPSSGVASSAGVEKAGESQLRWLPAVLLIVDIVVFTAFLVDFGLMMVAIANPAW